MKKLENTKNLTKQLEIAKLRKHLYYTREDYEIARARKYTKKYNLENLKSVKCAIGKTTKYKWGCVTRCPEKSPHEWEKPTYHTPTYHTHETCILIDGTRGKVINADITHTETGKILSIYDIETEVTTRIPQDTKHILIDNEIYNIQDVCRACLKKNIRIYITI